MQPNQYSSVRAGIFVVVSGAVLILGIMTLGQRSQFLARKFKVTVAFRNALGLIPGADVRIAGVTAGSVRNIEIVRTPGLPPMVETTLEIGTRFKDKVRRDSRASIRTLGPLGDKYVEVTMGSMDAPEIQPGASLEADEPVDFYQLAEQARETLERANRIAEEVAGTLSQVNQAAVIQDLSAGASALRRLLENVEKGPSLAHTLIHDPELPKILEDLRAMAQTLRASIERVDAGKGGLGEMIHGEQFAAAIRDMDEICASTRSILKQIEQGDGTAHALVYERHLQGAVAEVKEAAGRLNAILAQVQEKEGTLGLLIADPAVWESLNRLLGSAEESRVLKLLIRRAVRAEEEERVE